MGSAVGGTVGGLSPERLTRYLASPHRLPAVPEKWGGIGRFGRPPRGLLPASIRSAPLSSALHLFDLSSDFVRSDRRARPPASTRHLRKAIRLRPPRERWSGYTQLLPRVPHDRPPTRIGDDLEWCSASGGQPCNHFEQPWSMMPVRRARRSRDRFSPRTKPRVRAGASSSSRRTGHSCRESSRRRPSVSRSTTGVSSPSAWIRPRQSPGPITPGSSSPVCERVITMPTGHVMDFESNVVHRPELVLELCLKFELIPISTSEAEIPPGCGH